MPKKSFSPDLPKFLVCEDLNGVRWTVPPGTKLYTRLEHQIKAGYAVPVVSKAVLLNPDSDEPWDDEVDLVLAFRAPNTLAGFRRSEWERLRHRVNREGI